MRFVPATVNVPLEFYAHWTLSPGWEVATLPPWSPPFFLARVVVPVCRRNLVRAGRPGRAR